MSWLSGGELHSDAWTSSNYAGLGILFDNLPTTGENGGSPLLNDGGVNGDEVRWELLTTSGVTLIEFNEDGSFASDGIGSFTYRSYINNVAVVPDFTVTVKSESGIVDASISTTMPQMAVSTALQFDVEVASTTVALTMPQMAVSATTDLIVNNSVSAVAVTMPQMLVVVNRVLDTKQELRSLFKMPQMVASVGCRQFLGKKPGTFNNPTGNPKLYDVQ